jgi:hypothetical protein
LRLLCGSTATGMRGVGDPNQAIFETFTTASLALPAEFPKRTRRGAPPDAGFPRSTPRSSRCQPPDRLDAGRAPRPEVRGLSEPYIEPAPPGDLQPNPPDDLQ